jgi:hypothetical protein
MGEQNIQTPEKSALILPHNSFGGVDDYGETALPPTVWGKKPIIAVGSATISKFQRFR